MGVPSIPPSPLYVTHQEIHHRVVSFQEELRKLLAADGIGYDERYVWEKDCSAPSGLGYRFVSRWPRPLAWASLFRPFGAHLSTFSAGGEGKPITRAAA